MRLVSLEGGTYAAHLCGSAYAARHLCGSGGKDRFPAIQEVICRDRREQVHQARYSSGPTRLVTGADSFSVVAVKVFEKRDVVAPERIVLESLFRTEHWSPSIGPAFEYRRQSSGELFTDFEQA